MARITAFQFCICAIGFVTSAALDPASAGKYKVLYNFCSEGSSGNPCTDGSFPLTGLTMDGSGNFFGIAGAGGQNANGAIFELKPKGRGYVYRRLYSLAACASTCPDGAALENPLILDTSGNLYGVAESGGAHAGGVAFKLSPNSAGTKWAYKVLYAFCAEGGSVCTDGHAPDSGLSYAGAATGAPYDGMAALFGTAMGGGADYSGVLFRLSPGRKWTEKVVYNFCSKSGCQDGATPAGAIAVDASGTVFGTTSIGGVSVQTNSGVVYLVAGGTETVLHNFCGANPCHDGTRPVTNGVTLSSARMLLGATASGGKNGEGVAYQIDVKSHKETLLYAFCRKANCRDGDTPSGSPALDGSVKVGVTQEGGTFGEGALYRIAADGTESLLYAFCQVGGCHDGDNPVGNLIVDGKGNIFGVTTHGGAHNSGAVFEYSP